MTELHVFGVRHHGPGSARAVVRALEATQPDAVLVEGPPDADGLIGLVAHPELRPPAALLVYLRDDPGRAAFFPFATFSPEWQALRWAAAHGARARFMDLPHRYRLGPGADDAAPAPGPPRADPLTLLAEAAGYGDVERWWDHLIESRRDSTGVFDAVLEGMSAVRDELGEAAVGGPWEARREAWMRKTIREEMAAEGARSVAVVCGAWHAPALVRMPTKRSDSALLKGLSRAKTEAAWVPWSYDRLSYGSGYGAGVESPGWYDHLWTCDDAVIERWMTRVARLLRDDQLDASSAHVIEAVRLAEALAALRGRPLPGLPEVSEAARAVICAGHEAPMQLIRRKLVVGDRLGTIPEDAPRAPLHEDFVRTVRRARLKLEPQGRTIDLDLRKPIHLVRSHLLHRLALLGVTWGRRREVSGARGTFRETWELKWRPELIVSVIGASRYGNTLAEAATALAVERAEGARGLLQVARMLDDALLADLPACVEGLMRALEAQAAVASDVLELMEALGPLSRIVRYGNVRRTDGAVVARAVSTMMVRICAGLSAACGSLNDQAAEDVYQRVVAVDAALALLRDAAHTRAWRETLQRLTEREGLHGLIAGRATRLVHDSGALDSGEAARRMSLALSVAAEPAAGAAWVDGFLRGSAALLICDPGLLEVVDGWLRKIRGEHFDEVLPLLRRTFSTFEKAERRRLGEVVRGGATRHAQAGLGAALDEDRASRVLGVLEQILLPAAGGPA